MVFHKILKNINPYLESICYQYDFFIFTKKTLVFSFAILLWLSSNLFATDVEYVLPVESQSIIESLVADPFPKLCNSSLKSARINKNHVELVFEGEDKFSLRLVHSMEQSEFFYFKVDSENCEEVSSILYPLVKKRINENPWKKIAKENVGVITNSKSSSKNHKNVANKVFLIVNIFLCQLLMISLLAVFLIAVRVCYKDVKGRDFGSLLVFCVALLPATFIEPMPTNWYSIFDFDWYTLSSFAPGWKSLTTFLYAILPEESSVLESLVYLNHLCFAISGVLVYRIILKAGYQKNIAFVASLLFASIPALRILGAGDCQHVLALCLWLLTGFIYGYGNNKKLWLIPILLLVFLSAAIRIETIVWFIVWPILFKKSFGKAIKEIGIATCLCGVFLVPFCLMFFNYSFDTYYFSVSWNSILIFLKTPVLLWNGLLEPFIIRFLLFALSGYGLFCLFRESPRKSVGILVSIYVISIPAIFTSFSPGSQMTNRYYLSVFPLAFIIFAFGFNRLLGILSKQHVIFRVSTLLVFWIIFIYNSVLIYSNQEQFTFRMEYLFLKDSMKKVVQNSTICMISPKMNHYLQNDNSLDLDTSFLPKDGYGRYMGESVYFKLLGIFEDKNRGDNHFDTKLDTRCDYYYRSSVCRLSTYPKEKVYGKDEMKRMKTNLRKISDYCEEIEQANDLTLVNQATIKWKCYIDACPPSKLRLMLFKVGRNEI